MLKKIVLYIALLTSICSFAQAIYLRGSLGYLNDASDLIGSGAVGYQFLEGETLSHNVELELMYSQDTDQGVSIKMQPILLNYRAEKSLGENTFWYFGAGLGSISVDVKYSGKGGSGDGFAMQAFTGIGRKLTDNINLYGGLRYLDASEIKIRKKKVGSESDLSVEFGIDISL